MVEDIKTELAQTILRKGTLPYLVLYVSRAQYIADANHGVDELI